MSRFVVRRPTLVLAVALVGLGAACGSSDAASSDTAAPVDAAVAATTAPQAQGGGIGAAIKVAAGAPAKARDAACVVDLQSLQGASELYLALNGTLPASQDDLIDAQLIQERSVRFEISAEGEIVPAPGSPCT